MKLFLLAAGLLIFAPTLNAKSQSKDTPLKELTVYAEGIARTKDQKVTYKENHTMKVSKEGKVLELITVYSNAEDKEFGRLISKFDRHPYIPNYIFKDTRFGYEAGIKWNNDKDFNVFITKTSRDKKKTKTFSLHLIMAISNWK